MKKLNSQIALVLLFFLFVLFSCKKEPNTFLNSYENPSKISKSYPVTDSDLKLWQNENPVAQFLALDWKNAKHITIDGKPVVKVALLNESRMPVKNKQVTSSNNLKALESFNASFEKHPPEVFFVKNSKDSLHTYLLNFIPDDPSKEFGQNNIWTGKLHEWNLNSDSIFVHEYKQSILTNRFILKSNNNTNLNANNQVKIDSFWSWLGDAFDAIVGFLNDVGYLLHIPGTTTDYSRKYPWGDTRGWPSVHLVGDIFGGGGGDGGTGGSTSTGGGTGWSGGNYFYNHYFNQYEHVNGPNAGESILSQAGVHLISELGITEPELQNLLLFNDIISNELLSFLETNGKSAENKAFIYWATEYLNINSNANFSDLYENNQGGGEDEDFDINLLNQPQTVELMPTSINLNNGQTVRLIFGITQDGKSALQKVNKKLIVALQNALDNLPQNITINSLFIAASTNGVHGPNSNHPRGIALDISRINGIKMISSGITPEIISLQQSLDNLPNIRENFGPSFKHKNGLPWTISDHQDHIHFSINL